MAICVMCEREVPEIMVHHLVPKTTHKNKRVRKMFPTKEERSATIDTCRDCHKTIHAHVKEKKLALEYYSLELLMQHEGIRKFVDWIRTKPFKGKVQVSRSSDY